MASQTAKALKKAIRALGGMWDTHRSVTALRDGGLGDGDQQVQEKRARKALRDLAEAHVIVRTDPDGATYRLATEL
ncbi:hypothetical protein SFIMM107S_00365 [Streptomyces griseus]